MRRSGFFGRGFGRSTALTSARIPLSQGAAQRAHPSRWRDHAETFRRFARIRLVVAATATAVVSAALWPGFALVLAGVVGVGVAALLAPAYGFALAILLFGVEGSVKIALVTGGSPFGFDPRAVGAALIDLAFVAAVVGLVAAHPSALPQGWTRLGRGARIALGLLGAWLLMSVVQTVQTGSLVQGAAGFRLTQAYVLAALAGFVVMAEARKQDVVRPLVAVVGVVAGYAALRAGVGPSHAEEGFAVSRTDWAYYGDVFRNVGSFSGAVPLASFLVPAAVFVFGLALLAPRYRIPAAFGFACACIGIISTQTRAAVVALGVGLVVVGVFSGRDIALSRRGKAVAAAVTVVVLGATALGVVVGSRASPQTRERASGLLNPFADESLRLRVKTWRDSANEAVRHPLGTGIGTVGRASSLDGDFVTTDNSYLKVLREQGIFGIPFVAGLLLLCAALARGVWRAPQTARPLGVAAFAGFVSFLVLALAGEYFEQPGKVVAWTLLGIAAWQAWCAPRDRAGTSTA